MRFILTLLGVSALVYGAYNAYQRTQELYQTDPKVVFYAAVAAVGALLIGTARAIPKD